LKLTAEAQRAQRKIRGSEGVSIFHTSPDKVGVCQSGRPSINVTYQVSKERIKMASTAKKEQVASFIVIGFVVAAVWFISKVVVSASVAWLLENKGR